MNIKKLVPFTFVLFIFIAFGIVSSQAKSDDAELTPMEKLGKNLLKKKSQILSIW